MSAATATQPQTLKQHALENMKFAHASGQQLMVGFPDNHACFQATPTDNHLLWTLGHLAATNGWFVTLLDANAKSNVPENYNALFGMESKPLPDAAKYPAFATVRKVYEDSFAQLVKVFEGLPESQMSSPVVGNGYGFCNSKVDVAMKSAWHEGYHFGQVAGLRKVLGITKKK